VHSNQLLNINNNKEFIMITTDAMRTLKGVPVIAKYWGYTREHFQKQYIPIMLDNGFAWKNGNFKTAKVVTTPFLLNMFFSWYHTEYKS
jgi:hypothetical protein